VIHRLRGTPLSAASLYALFVTVFFSVTLQNLSAALAWCSALARLRAGRRAGDGPVRAAFPLGLVGPLAVFFGASALSAGLGVAPLPALRTLGSELLTAGVALAAATIPTLRRARRLAAVFLCAASVAGAWSVYQVVFEFGRAVDFGHRAHGFWDRTAFFSYANVLAIAFALALGFFYWGRSRERALGLASGALAALGMVLSYTRSSWLVSAALVAGASVARRAIVPLAGIALVAAAVLLLPASDDSREIIARARSSFDPAAATNVDRLARYRAGVAIVRDYPLLGTGPGGVALIYPAYTRPGATEAWHLHNTYLQLLAERGPLATAAWLVTMIWGVGEALRASRRLGADGRGLAVGLGLALAAMLLLGAFNYHWEDWRVRSITLALLGLAWSPALAGGPVTDDLAEGKTSA
jgi:O-antigen ligase